MIGGGPQKITVEIGGKIAASLGASLRSAQVKVSSFGRNVTRTMNDAAASGRKGFKGIFDNALWQQAAVGAAGIGVALAGSVRTAARFESVLADIGKTANVGDVELKKLSGQILQLSGRNITNLAPEKLAAGIQDLVAQGLELNDAVASMEALGRVATATNSDLLDVTKTGFQLQNALKIRPTELKATFDALAFAGKQGAFELKDMAQFMPTIAAAAGTMGIEGKKGAVALAAMMQMVRKDAPDAGQAATRMTDAMLKMTAPDAVKNFSKFGVNIEQVLKDAKAKGINPMEAAIAELQRVTGGDVFKLSQIFGDKEAKLGLMSLMKYRKEYEKLKADAGGQTAAGTVDKDYQRSLKTFQGTLTSFQNSAQRLGIAVGNALLPPLTRLAEIITPLAEGFANFAASNPRIATGIVLIGGALAGLVLALPVIAGVVTAIGTLKTALVAVNLGGLIAGWLPAIAGLGTAIWTASLPLLPWVALIAGIGVGIYALVKNWDAVKAAALSAWKSIGDKAIAIWEGTKREWGQWTSWFGDLFNKALGIIRAWGPKVLAVMFPVPALIINLFTNAGIGQKIITSIIDGLKARAGALFSWIGSAVSRIGSMINGGGGGSAPAAPAAPAAPTAPAPPGRANGGRVLAGMGYIVGERRRELFVPGMDGAIIPRIAQPISVAPGRQAAPTVDLRIPSQGAAPQSKPPITINAPITIHAAGGDSHSIREQVRLAFEDLLARVYGDYRVALND
jgi:TP901 family phage tail tape measure protein